MIEETTPSAEYLKGFNEGYVLAKESPALAEKLLSVKGETDRLKGFADGQKQFVVEKPKDHRPAWLTKDRTKDREMNDRSRDLDVDLDR